MKKAILRIFRGSMNCKIELRPFYVDDEKSFVPWMGSK